MITSLSSPLPASVTARAERLQHLIHASTLSKKEFAQAIEVSTRIVHLWETGVTPLSERNAKRITDALKKVGLTCSLDWLLHGEGHAPVKDGEINDSSFHLERFNLDFSFASLINFYKKTYPDSRMLIIDDHRFVPRIPMNCLLIGVPVPREKFKTDWTFGYLFILDDFQVMPIDIVQNNDQLVATPFAQRSYKAESFPLSPTDPIYPIINIRPLY